VITPLRIGQAGSSWKIVSRLPLISLFLPCVSAAAGLGGEQNPALPQYGQLVQVVGIPTSGEGQGALWSFRSGLKLDQELVAAEVGDLSTALVSASAQGEVV